MINNVLVKCANIALFCTLIIGLILMITEISETESLWSVIKVNGGGALMFSVSLLLLSVMNRDPGEGR